MKSRFIIILLSVALSVCVLSSCSEEKSEVMTISSSNFATTATSNMETIDNDFVPDSMDADATSSGSMANTILRASSDDPCEGTDLFGCQPRLVKLYLRTSRSFFRSARQFISEMGTNLGQLVDGSSGVANMSDGTTIHYSKVSATEWEVLAVTSGGTFFDVSILGNVYTLKIDNNNRPETTGDSSKLEIVVNYTDNSNWQVTSTILGSSCNDSDPQAPERIRVIIAKANGMHTGKAMLYSPRWAYFQGNSSCALDIEDDYTMDLYTDFVASSSAAKAKVYMMKRTVSEVADIANYPMSAMCDVYFANFGFGDATSCSTLFAAFGFDLSSYPNPFCTTGRNHADWGSDCSDVDTTISSASFSASSNWTAPAAFYLEAITLRSSL